MSSSARISRTLIAGLTLALVAGCADQASAPPSRPAASSSAGDPELAGAWYQIYFDTNKVDINERGRMIIKAVANVVANAGPTRVTVIGKTDRVGAPSANLALSQQRADHVRDALIAAGVPANNIDTSWTGESKQQVSTADEFSEQRNRVVDITVVKQAR